MAQDHFDRSIFEVVNQRAIALEDYLSTDVIFYNGSIYTPTPEEAEFDVLTAGFETIQLCL